MGWHTFLLKRFYLSSFHFISLFSAGHIVLFCWNVEMVKLQLLAFLQFSYPAFFSPCQMCICELPELRAPVFVCKALMYFQACKSTTISISFCLLLPQKQCLAGSGYFASDAACRWILEDNARKMRFFCVNLLWSKMDKKKSCQRFFTAVVFFSFAVGRPEMESSRFAGTNFLFCFSFSLSCGKLFTSHFVFYAWFSFIVVLFPFFLSDLLTRCLCGSRRSQQTCKKERNLKKKN